MSKQKNSGFIFMIVGIIGAMMVIFFNLFQHTNRQDLLNPVPGTGIYNTYRFLCILAIGIVICFGLTVLCISIRFHQQYLVSILFLGTGILSVVLIQYIFSNYYEIHNVFLWPAANHGLKIGILFLLSLILYTMFELPNWVKIVSASVNGCFLVAVLIFLIFAKAFTLPARNIFYGICYGYEAVCIIALIVNIIHFVKKDVSYSTHVLVALVAFACYLPAELIFRSFQPCYLTFYEVSLLILYAIMGFTLLNYIISSYDSEQRYIALEHETDKNFIRRREHYETFAEQLDGVKEIPEYTYSPILAVEALLLYYAKYAKMNKIDFQVNFDVPKNVRVKHSELCLTLANLLDNAVEACDKMESGRKYIHLEANIVGHMMMLEVRNSYDGLPLVSSGDLYNTTKEYTPKGMGLTTTKDIATRYNGSLTLQAKADVPEPYFNAQLFFSRVAD